MKRVIYVLTLVLVLSLCIFGCSTEPDSAGGGDSKDSQTQTETTDDKAAGTDAAQGDTATQDTAATGGQAATGSNAAAQNTAGDTSNKDTGTGRFNENINPETQEFMNNITGTWESSTPLEDGNASIIRVKIDNVSGLPSLQEPRRRMEPDLSTLVSVLMK